MPRWLSACGMFRGALLLSLLCSSACASLPDAQRDRAQTPSAPISFETAKGAVSAARSDAILDQLEGGDGNSALLQKHLVYEQAIDVRNPLVLGNRLQLLQNGPATYTAMFAAIRAARDHINLETFIFDDDEIGREFSRLLLERQAAGVQVTVIHDSVGGITTPGAFYDRLREGGIKVLEFNPVNPLSGDADSWGLNNRDHRKQLIVDGRIAFIGGINISDSYASTPSGKRRGRAKEPSAKAKAGWRDTHVRIEGPAVAEFQKLFLATWARQNGPPLPPRNYFPPLQRQGDAIVRAIGSSADEPHNPIYLTLLSAISHAEHSVQLTIAYFAPDPQLLKVLTDAAARGVEVSLLLPSQTDSWAVFHLGRSYYGKLLRGGVHIYERHGTVMHAKTACIDGVWSTIGSTNLDWRSFLHNDEINAVILSRDFAAEMETMFAQDLRESQPILLKQWRRRSWWLRIQERAARIGAYWL